ncbi:TPA: hypothetical protein EYP38_04650, partial [Candidatus Micrarchaeota archaeon]|nr:hypothetical protein [Candidatus Micrarchaeota archaeon]
MSKERTGCLDWEALFRRSRDNGVSWDEGYFSYFPPPNEWCGITSLASSRTPTDNPGFAYTHKDGEGASSETYWRKVENDGSMSAEMQASISDSYDSYHPRIDTDGTNYFIIWAEYDSAPGPRYLHQIVVDRWDGTDNRTVLQFTDTGVLEYPDIAKQAGGTFYSTWLDRDETDWWIRGCEYNGGWGSIDFIVPGSGTVSCPRVLPNIEAPVVFRSPGDSTKVDKSYLPGVMLDCGPKDGESLATTNDGTNSYLAVSSWKAANTGPIKVKRMDKAGPSGTVTTNGGTCGDRQYVQPRFDIIFRNVVDDWNVTGTDPLGDSYTNGVT